MHLYVTHLKLVLYNCIPIITLHYIRF